MLKRCPQCEERLPPERFGIDRSRHDGLQGLCKVCRNRLRRARRKEPGYKGELEFLRRNPMQHAAAAAVHRALNSGRLVRPEVCEECGQPGMIQAHHDDYSLRLAVRWLCTRCHAETHLARVRVDMRLPKELVEAVDEARGDVSRTRWIERALEKALGGGAVPDGARSAAGPVDEPAASPRTSEVAPVDPVLKDPPGDLPKIARRHWA